MRALPGYSYLLCARAVGIKTSYLEESEQSFFAPEILALSSHSALFSLCVILSLVLSLSSSFSVSALHEEVPYFVAHSFSLPTTNPNALASATGQRCFHCLSAHSPSVFHTTSVVFVFVFVHCTI